MRIFAAPALGLAVTLAASCATSSSNTGEENAQNPAATEGQDEAAAQAAPQDPEEYLGQEWEVLTLQEQKKRFLIERHIDNARSLMEGLQLEDARLETNRALNLDPDNLEAKQLAAEIGLLLNDDSAELLTGAQALEEMYLLKKDQAEADARDSLAKAKLHQARGEWDQAIAELTLCKTIVTLSPYEGEWQELAAEVDEMLVSAKAERSAAEERQLEEDQRRAREALREQELAEQERRDNVLTRLLDDSITAFNLGDYDEAKVLAERVLRLDPRNEMALDISDTAFRKGRELVRNEYLAEKREQYRRWQEEMEELRVPYQDVITLSDPDEWQRITELRGRRPGLDLSQSVDPGEVALRDRLRNTTIPGLRVEDEESLATVIRAISLSAQVAIVTDPLAEDAALTNGAIFNFDFTHPLTVEKALNIVAGIAGEDVTWTVRHETVLVTTVEKARGDLVIVNHDVQDLTFALTDFLGPRIGQLRLIDELEDDDGGSPFGGISEKPQINEPDALRTLVEENVANGTWSDDGISLEVEGGNMLVVHTPAVQQEVRRFLEELRRFSSSLVTIESKFLVLQEGFIQEIGVDWRGLENPGIPYTDLDDLNLDDTPTLGLDNGGDGVAVTAPSSGAFFDDGQDGSFAGRTENLFGSALGSALSTVGGLTTQYTFLNDLELSMILRLVEKSQNAELINDQVLSVHNTQRAYVTVVNQLAYVQDFDVEVAC